MNPRGPVDLPKCGARAKSRNGEPCGNIAMHNGRCHIHGGKTPVGAAVKHFKYGRYSKYMPPSLADRYKKAWSDPEALSLMSELMALDSFVVAEFESLKDSMPVGWRAELRAMADNVVRLERIAQRLDQTTTQYREIKDQSNAQVREIIRILRETEPNEEQQIKARTRITDLFEQRRKLVESERKRLTEIEQKVTVEEMMAISRGLLHAVINNVSNPLEIEKVQKEFALIMGYQPPRVINVLPVAPPLDESTEVIDITPSSNGSNGSNGTGK